MHVRRLLLIYVKPTSDIFIKYLFGKEEHKPLLLDFINAVQKSRDFPLIKDLEIKNPFNIKTIAAEKESSLDIKAWRRMDVLSTSRCKRRDMVFSGTGPCTTGPKCTGLSSMWAMSTGSCAP